MIPEPAPVKPLRVEITNYWIVELEEKATWASTLPQSEWGGDDTIPVKVGTETQQRRYPHAFIHAVMMQGCAKVPDGVLTYDGHEFALLDRGKFPWGQAATGEALTPLVSIAVDPHFIPLRTWCMMPALKGFYLPDNTRHDGRVYACDTGGRIRGAHVDLFVGKAANKVDGAVGEWDPKTRKAYVDLTIV